MASLTEVSYQTRNIIKYGSLALIIIVAGKILLDLTISVWKKLHPPPPPPPTVSFGKIPSLEFPLSKFEGWFQYNLETPTGKLPDLGDRATVYFMPAARPNLLALDKSKEEANLMGFNSEPESIAPKIYQWTKQDPVPSTLEMDIFSGSFVLDYNWNSDPNILIEKNLPGKEQVKFESQNFLQRTGLLEEDLVNGKIEVEYLRVAGNDFVPVMSLSEANFVKAEIFRTDINNIPILTPDPKKGVVSIIFSGSNNAQKRIIKVEFNYYPIKYDSLATYPIKTTATAFEELKAGQGFVASFKGEGRNITVRRVYLAYYDADKMQKFMQPIIVFEGDNDFFAYVMAVTQDWTL